MDLDLTGKTAVVTGGSKGIGLATAQALSAEGVVTTLVARDPEALGVAQAAVPKSQILVADLGTEAGRAALAEAVGTPDILVNNAGAVPPGGLRDLSMEDWRAGWELKVFGYIDLCRLIYPGMMDRGWGTIINIIGMAGAANRPDYICGSAGNAALIAFTNALGAEAQGAGVRVFGINPSPTLTGRMERFLRHRAETALGDAALWRDVIDPARYPFGRPADPAEIGTLATMLCAPAVTYLNGTVLDVDGGAQWKG